MEIKGDPKSKSHLSLPLCRIVTFQAQQLLSFICTEAEHGAWWMVDMGGTKCVGKVIIWNRVETGAGQHGCCGIYVNI